MIVNNATNVAEASQAQMIETQLGLIDKNLGITLSFPKGLIGFEQEQEFILAPMPNKGSHLNAMQDGSNAFLIMQSMQTPKLCFIVLPYELPISLENQKTDDLITVEDILPYVERYGLEGESIGIFLIVSFESKLPKEAGHNITVNMKAPVIVDINSGNAWQVILQGNQSLSYRLA